MSGPAKPAAGKRPKKKITGKVLTVEQVEFQRTQAGEWETGIRVAEKWILDMDGNQLAYSEVWDWHEAHRTVVEFHE